MTILDTTRLGAWADLPFFTLDLPGSRDFYAKLLGYSVLAEEDWGFCMLALPESAGAAGETM